METVGFHPRLMRLFAIVSGMDMRAPGRVLFSRKTLRVIMAPSTLTPRSAANLRYNLKRAATSAVDDMIFIHRNGDRTMKKHMEDEAARLISKIGLAAEPRHEKAADAESGQDRPEDDSDPQAVKDLEDSVW